MSRIIGSELFQGTPEVDSSKVTSVRQYNEFSPFGPLAAIMTGSIRVLHVDDEPDFADLTGTYLERENDQFVVETATSASEAFDRIRATGDAIDCIVSDYDMPGQNGIEFLEAIREEYPDLPFILYTGKGSEEVASDAISAGVTDYLQKGSGTDQYTVLANRIWNIVSAYRSKHEAERRQHRLEQTLKTVPACVVQIDYDGQFVFANDRAEEVLGLDPKDVSKRTYNDPEWNITDLAGNPIPDEELPFRRVRDSGEPIYGFRHTIEWPDGTTKTLLVNGAPLFDESGEVESTVFALTDITDRQNRVAKLEQIKQNVTDVIWISSPEKDSMEFISDSYEEVWGQSPESLRETPTAFVDSIHPEDRDRIREALAEQQQNPDEYEETYRIVRPDGEVRWVHDRSAGVYEDGRLTRIVGIASDITERKHHEQKRKQIIDRVTDAIVEVDADWGFTLVNEQAEELYDMDEEDLLGRDFWAVFAEAQDTRFEEEYRRVMESREPTSFVEYFSQLDGWFDIEAYPKDDGGLAFYFREVTDRVQRSRELEQKQEQFAYLEDVADIGYWEIDTKTPEPYDVTLSDGVYHVHDLSPEDPFDVEKAIEFYHPEDRAEVRGAVRRAVAEGEPYEYEARLITDTGRERWVHALGEPVVREGEVVRVRGSFQDITERKHKEQELAHQNERLEEFASIVSHDLRNPLTLLEGRLELLGEEFDSEHFEPMERAIDRMNRMIDDVLWLAREGQDIGSTAPVSVQSAVESAWGLVADTVDTAELHFADDGAPLPTIKADPDRLSQLLENLLRNAIEHGGEEVNVTIGRLADGFYVEDDGPGIPEAERDQVLTSGYSTLAAGSGFGLRIVARVAEAHGWETRVTDGTEGGARFEFTRVEFVDG